MQHKHGVMVISLDFELYWGVRDRKSISQYRENLDGVRNAIIEILRVFRENEIHATWATVGFLFFNDLKELTENLPKLTPTYISERYSPYNYINSSDKLESQYHFAPDVIKVIQQQKGQEIGTHTFSHYYCLEDGQSIAEFREDISMAIKTAQKYGIFIKSLVFPRNQWKAEYLTVLNELGIECFRGNELGWIYRAAADQRQSMLQRAIRLVDSYVNISGYHTYGLYECVVNKPFNFPASRFLRPCSERIALFSKLHLIRIIKAMHNAAQNNRIFHLWWHPHNFGVNTSGNIAFLERIISHYRDLQQTYGMKSLNMSELCQLGGIND